MAKRYRRVYKTMNEDTYSGHRTSKYSSDKNRYKSDYKKTQIPAYVRSNKAKAKLNKMTRSKPKKGRK